MGKYMVSLNSPTIILTLPLKLFLVLSFFSTSSYIKSITAPNESEGLLRWILKFGFLHYLLLGTAAARLVLTNQNLLHKHKQKIEHKHKQKI